MTDNITAIPVATRVPDGSPISIKPCHLVVFVPEKANTKTQKLFVALERPLLETGYIQAKGFFVDSDKESIINSWQDMVKMHMTDKKNVVEIYVPWLKIDHIQNLVYKADKSK